MTRPVRVLIVDDSAVIRQLLTMLLSEDPEIEVVGTARRSVDRARAASRRSIRTSSRSTSRCRTWTASLPAQDHGAAADAGGHDLDADAGRRRHHARGARNRRGRFHRQADDRCRRRRWPRSPIELQTKVKAAARARVRPASARAAAPPHAARVRADRASRAARSSPSAHRPAASRRCRTVLMAMPADCPPILDHPAHAAALHRGLRRAPQPRMPDDGCPKRRTTKPVEPGHVYIAPGGSHHLETGPRSGIRIVCSAAATDRRCPVIGRRSTCCSARSRASPVAIRGRRDPDRHGQGRRRRHARDAQRRRHDARPGRSVVADLRHAAGGFRARRA